jgi:hypothetical protein
MKGAGFAREALADDLRGRGEGTCTWVVMTAAAAVVYAGTAWQRTFVFSSMNTAGVLYERTRSGLAACTAGVARQAPQR